MATAETQAPQLVEMLAGSGVLTKAQLDAARQKQRLFGGTLGLHLLAGGYLTEPVLQAYLEQFFQNPEGLPYHAEPEPEALSLLDRDRAARLKVVPLNLTDERIFVLALNPSDDEAMREVKRRTGREVVATVVNELRLMWLLDRWYGIAVPAHLERSVRMLFGVEEKPAAVAEVAAGSLDPDDSILYDPLAGVSEAGEVEDAIGLGTPGAFALEDGEEVIPILDEELPLLIIETDELEEEALQKEKEHEDMPVGHGLEPLPPAGFDQALSDIGSLEELSELFQRFGSAAFKSMAVFKVQAKVIAGWRSAGEGVRAESVREIRVSSEGDSVLARGTGPDALVTSELGDPEDAGIAETLGMTPGDEMVVYAVNVRNRPVLVVCGVLKTGLDGGAVCEDLKTLCDKAASAVVRIILAKKKQKPGPAAEEQPDEAADDGAEDEGVDDSESGEEDTGGEEDTAAEEEAAGEEAGTAPKKKTKKTLRKKPPRKKSPPKKNAKRKKS